MLLPLSLSDDCHHPAVAITLVLHGDLRVGEAPGEEAIAVADGEVSIERAPSRAIASSATHNGGISGLIPIVHIVRSEMSGI